MTTTDWMTYLSKAKYLSTPKKVILVLLVTLAAIFCLCSCTSYRSTSVTVDKAEKVDINVKDSINSVYPSFLGNFH